MYSLKSFVLMDFFIMNSFEGLIYLEHILTWTEMPLRLKCLGQTCHLDKSGLGQNATWIKVTWTKVTWTRITCTKISEPYFYYRHFLHLLPHQTQWMELET